MAEAQVFRYKPALLRGSLVWTLDGEVLRGPEGEFDLSTVTGTRITETAVQSSLTRRLDLEHPGGILQIGVTGAGKGDPDMAVHADLMAAVFRVLAARDPEIPLVVGERGAARIAMFGIGVVAVLFAVVMAIALVSGNGRSSAEAVSGIVVLGAFGLVLSLRNRPWRALPSLPVAVGAVMAEALKG